LHFFHPVTTNLLNFETVNFSSTAHSDDPCCLQPVKITNMIPLRLVLWSRIRDRVSDWLWSWLRSYWLVWSLTSVCYTGLWSRSP